MATDYDTPRKTDDDLNEDSLEELKARRAEARGPASGKVVWNDGELGALEAEVARVLQDIRQSSPVWWSWLLLLLPPLAAVIALFNIVRSWMIRRKWERQRTKRIGSS